MAVLSWIRPKSVRKENRASDEKPRSNVVSIPRQTKAIDYPVVPMSAQSSMVEYPAYDRMFSARVDPEKPVMFIGKDLTNFGIAVEWFRALGVRCYVLDSLDDAVGVLADNPLRWGFLFVSIDDFGGPLEIVDDLAKMRRRLAQVPTIIMSAGFGRNDFGTGRLQVADVSLRLPMSLAALESAVEEAVPNCQISICRVCARCEKFE